MTSVRKRRPEALCSKLLLNGRGNSEVLCVQILCESSIRTTSVRKECIEKALHCERMAGEPHTPLARETLVESASAWRELARLIPNLRP